MIITDCLIYFYEKILDGFLANSSLKSGLLPCVTHFLKKDVYYFPKKTSLYFINFGSIIFRSVKSSQTSDSLHTNRKTNFDIMVYSSV